MAKKRARLTRWCILISLLLVTCGPVVAQYSDVWASCRTVLGSSGWQLE